MYSSLARLGNNFPKKQINLLTQPIRLATSVAKSSTIPVKNDEKKFRVLNLNQNQNQWVPKKRPPVKETFLRHRKMSVTQNWGDVWPGPKTFHPASVPLPLRQGFREPQDKKPAPSKYVNAELMKIPNFLHLTPPVIKRQCEILKRFCTPWPVGLETDEKCDEHFPIEYISSDYCQGLPTIRNPLSRIVTLRLKLSNLPLDKHAKDKILRLVESRYDPETDMLTLVTDRCPLRKQNLEYAQYLLTALFHESYIIEPWESIKSEADMEYYDWNRNKSKEIVEEILKYGNRSDASLKSTDGYAKSVEDLFNDGENEQNIQKYKEEVLKLLDLKQ